MNGYHSDHWFELTSIVSVSVTVAYKYLNRTLKCLVSWINVNWYVCNTNFFCSVLIFIRWQKFDRLKLNVWYRKNLCIDCPMGVDYFCPRSRRNIWINNDENLRMLSTVDKRNWFFFYRFAGQRRTKQNAMVFKWEYFTMCHRWFYVRYVYGT